MLVDVECVANISSVFYSHLITVVALHLFHYTALCIAVVGPEGLLGVDVG